MAKIVVSVVVPLTVAGRAFVYVGDLDDGQKLVVELNEWETKRPIRGRMRCFYWNGLNGDGALVTPAPDLQPEG